MKIAFMGTSDFAVPALDLLIDKAADIVCVVTRPDRPGGRGRKLIASPVKRLAEKKGIALFQPGNLKSEPFISRFREFMPDIIAVVAFGQIISKEIIEMPRFGCVNLHPSLLPKYRGAAPVNWAIINGERVTGVTTILMDEGIDTGDILLQKEVAIEEDDTSESLHDKLARIGAELLVETLRRTEESTINSVPQDHSQATSVPMLKKEDGLIDWSEGCRHISNQIKGLLPWPGAFTRLRGKRLKIFKGVPLEEGTQMTSPGNVSETSDKGIKVSTGDGFLMIKELQLQDHKRMRVADFLRGHKDKVAVGTILK